MSGPAGTSSSGSRAFVRGSRRAVWLVLAIAGAAAVIVVLAVLLTGRASPRGAGLPRGTAIGTPHGSKQRYGGLPAWLPKAKVPVGRVLHASSAQPALSIQGEGISVDLGGASVLATAAGPSVPEEGRTPVPETSPCTFIVSFAHASSTIPLDPSSFRFFDERGRVHRGHVTAMGGGPAPTAARPGQTVSLEIKAVLPTGDGALAWSPLGGRPIASWDFDVEID